MPRCPHACAGRAPARAAVLLAAVALALLPACSDDDPTATSTTTTTAAATQTTADALSRRLIDLSALPGGFRAAGDIDDTITAFCAGEDATVGLSASERVLAGFQRDEPGSSVVQLVFRFEDDDAAAFVAQTAAIIDRCSEVPDLSGLAFDYEPVSEVLTNILAATDGHASGYGTSIGSGNLTVNIAAFHRGSIGQLIAVLGIGLARHELDELARAALTAAAERL